MKKKSIFFSLVALLGIVTAFSACEKSTTSSTEGTTKVQIKMTDAPGNFQKINLNVKEIVLFSDGKPYTFDATTPIFNILDFRTGTSNPDILVASGEMPSGEITEIRLVLDDAGNSIVVDGVQQSLTIPSGQSSGWKVKLSKNPSLVPGVTYSLLLDFDAASSIVKAGNGKYILKPVVRGITEATSGLISGTVMPLESHPEVLVIAGTDTVGTIADPLTGKFAIGGLAAGTYAVKFAPVTGFKATTITDISVAHGQNTQIGTVVLKQ